MDRGEAVTWCYDGTNSPIDSDTMLGILRDIMADTEKNCGVRFEEVEFDPNCDINIDFQQIDGSSNSGGSVLGRVFLPVSGSEIPVCDCGNVELDQDESLSLTDWYNVILHEWSGHAMGIFHQDRSIERTIMNPFLQDFGGRVLIENDPYLLRELQLRYPV